jgi:hypothetical protein
VLIPGKYVVQSDPDLPKCSGERVLTVISGLTLNFLYRGKLITPVNRGATVNSISTVVLTYHLLELLHLVGVASAMTSHSALV